MEISAKAIPFGHGSSNGRTCISTSVLWLSLCTGTDDICSDQQHDLPIGLFPSKKITCRPRPCWCRKRNCSMGCSASHTLKLQNLRRFISCCTSTPKLQGSSVCFFTKLVYMKEAIFWAFMTRFMIPQDRPCPQEFVFRAHTSQDLC